MPKKFKSGVLVLVSAFAMGEAISNTHHSSSVSGRERQEVGDSPKCIDGPFSFIHLERVSGVFNNVSLPTQQRSWKKYCRSQFYNILAGNDVSNI